jgi:hypothetical protein
MGGTFLFLGSIALGRTIFSAFGAGLFGQWFYRFFRRAPRALEHAEALRGTPAGRFWGFVAWPSHSTELVFTNIELA